MNQSMNQSLTEQEGRLQQHPLFGLNPRCICYDGGLRLVLLGGGTWAMFPLDIADQDSVPFQTEFAALLQSEEAVESRIVLDGDDNAVQAVVVGGADGNGGEGELETRTHMARSQRIYSNAQLATASTAFLTLGGMQYSTNF